MEHRIPVCFVVALSCKQGKSERKPRNQAPDAVILVGLYSQFVDCLDNLSLLSKVIWISCERIRVKEQVDVAILRPLVPVNANLAKSNG